MATDTTPVFNHQITPNMEISKDRIEYLLHLIVDDVYYNATKLRAEALEMQRYLQAEDRGPTLFDTPPTTPHYDRIREFMKLLPGRKVPEKLTIPDVEIRRLLAMLIIEEALETVTALGFNVWAGPENTEPKWLLNGKTDLVDFQFLDCVTPNLEEVIDGCCDISVVAIGTLIAFGLPDQPFLEEVDRANLRKFEVPPICPNCREAMWWFAGGAEQPSTEAWVCPTWDCLGEGQGNTRLPKEAGPYLREDGKWIKPPYWTPPDHAAILEEL